MAAAAVRGRDLPPDHEERSLVTAELDRNLLVEAAAGTGKTTCMVDRMLALLRTGRCESARNLVAITFTRKAAAEIRVRFQVRLEEEARLSRGEEGERLRRALEEVDQCFTGTIHSFCARLLRERPVEAGVDVSFREADEREDALLRRRAWEEFLALAEGPDRQGLMEELAACGLALSQLEDPFHSFLDYPDVEEWPAPESGDIRPVMDRARRELVEYVSHMESLRPSLPEDSGSDQLIPKLRRLPRAVSHYRLDLDRELAQALELFEGKVSTTVKKIWESIPGLGLEAMNEELRRWNAFQDDVARPALAAWRAQRYSVALRALQSAREVYDRLRAEKGVLNFQDLLLKAAALLRHNPGVRRYFQSRFTHLLVDEFQDTDPVQAEVIMLLASPDLEEKDWRRCRPRPGSLFLVGDPKQSIYRFRRADITTYNEVKEILTRTDGLLVRLSANFRSSPELVQWINEAFSPRDGDGDPDMEGLRRFPGTDGEESPAYVALLPARKEGGEADLRGVYRLPIPAELSRKEEVLHYEADYIARFIRHALDSGLRVPRSLQEMENGRPPQVDPSDFLVITPTRRNLAVFALKLQEFGIPHRVSGGYSLNEVPELQLLLLCLQAVLRPDDPLALVSVLRSELFGLSDADLYAYKKHGGSFSYYAEVPPGLAAGQEEAFRDAFQRLRRYHAWLRQAPPLAALEKMVGDLGLPALAAARPGGEVQAGGLAKALELLRATGREAWSFSELTDYLERLVSGEETFDAMSVLPGERPAVRLMNLHRVKGLEAPVVFLADTYGDDDRPVKLHVDRSGRRITGYLAVVSTNDFGKVTGVLAHPEGWEEREERERRFLEAERLRLRYVAATRAGAACVISVRETKGKHNFWRHFAPLLENRPVLPDPGRVAPRGEEEKPPAPEAFPEVMQGVERRRERARVPTYQVRAAKEFSLQSLSREAYRLETTRRATGEGLPVERELLQEAPVPPRGVAEAELSPPSHDPGPDEGKGAPWGEVVHLLLRAAVEEPGADLLPLAKAALRERELPEALAGEACRLVEGVLDSSIWKRARESDCCLAEVPFQVPEEHAPVPTVLRGVVDLAFRENGEWVLVDYKTDRPQGSGDEAMRRLVDRYAPQLRLYARAWERCTGQPVKEAFLYFLGAGSTVRVV